MKVKELAASATQKDYVAKKIDEPRREKPVDKEREEHFRNRDFVWGFLRQRIHEYEDAQREFKRILKAGNMSKVSVKIFSRNIINNAETLSGLYASVVFLRKGEVDYEAENFINEHFHKNQIFRNAYWTLWNHKFNRKSAPATENTASGRCPRCKRFVSKKTKHCNGCGFDF